MGGGESNAKTTAQVPLVERRGIFRFPLLLTEQTSIIAVKNDGEEFLYQFDFYCVNLCSTSCQFFSFIHDNKEFRLTNC